MIMKAEGTTAPVIWPAVRGSVVPGTIAIAAVFCPATQADASSVPDRIPQAAVMEYWQDGGRIAAMKLLDTWIDQTAFHSSPTIILRSQSFLEVQKLRGERLRTDLLELLDTHPYHAILALGELVSPLPFGEELAGDVSGQVRAWKEWASAEQEQSRRGSAELVSELGDSGMGGDEPL